MPSKNINIAKSSNSIPTWAIDFPYDALTAWLEYDLPLSVVVPGNCNIAIISYSSGPNVIVNTGSSAESIPVLGAAFTATQGRINPPSCWVTPGQTIYFRSANSGGDIVSIAFYDNKEYRS